MKERPMKKIESEIQRREKRDIFSSSLWREDSKNKKHQNYRHLYDDGGDEVIQNQKIIHKPFFLISKKRSSELMGNLLILIPMASKIAFAMAGPGVSRPISETLFAPNGPVGS